MYDTDTQKNIFALPSEGELLQGVRWLIRLRWLAILGVLIALALGEYVFHFPLYREGILWVAVILALLNVVYWSAARGAFEVSADYARTYRLATLFANFQISLDLVLLTLLLHFSGGAENPFVFFYIFHVILAGILLRRYHSTLQAVWAVLLFSGLALSRYVDSISHYGLFHAPGTVEPMSTEQLLVLMGAFVVTVAVSAYLTSSIMDRLRSKEQEIAQAMEELGRRERVKSDFAATVAHELKSPMGSIMNFIHAVRLTEADSISDKSLEFLDKTTDRVQGLMSLIRDLLDLAHLEALEPVRAEDLEEIDVVAEWEMVLGVERSSPETKGVRVEFEHSMPVPAILYSRSSIQQILSNLTSNALRYTPPGGVVKLSVTADRGKVVCTISDTGIGIAESDRERIFSEFYRAPNAKQFSPAGTGLGLAITRALLGRYGGTISMESEEGQGTTFTVSFNRNPGKELLPG